MRRREDRRNFRTVLVPYEARGCARRGAASVSMASAAAGAASKAARKAAFKRYPVSPALKRFLGVGEISRPDSLKQVWAYVKSHALQNPLRRREIVCDEKLKSIFGGKYKVDFLEVPGLLSSHFSKST